MVVQPVKKYSNDPMLDHEQLIGKVRNGYIQTRLTLIFGVCTAAVVGLAVALYFSSHEGPFSPLSYMGVGLGAILLGAMFFLPLVIGNRISNAMLPDMVGPKHVQGCLEHLKAPDDLLLQEIYEQAQAEQSALQTSTVLPNLMWAGLLALVAFADTIAWSTSTGLSIAVSVSVVILVVTISSLLSVERTQANTVIIKAISQHRVARLREKEVLRKHLLLSNLMSQQVK